MPGDMRELNKKIVEEGTEIKMSKQFDEMLEASWSEFSRKQRKEYRKFRDYERYRSEKNKAWNWRKRPLFKKVTGIWCD